MVLMVKDWDKAPTKVEKIADLVLDFRLYPRKEIDRQVVKTYAKALEAGSVFPHVKVALFDGQKVIVDGFHRVESRILLKIDYADCSILPFQNEAELFAEAVRLNSDHGKGFTEIELKANIRRLQKYKFDVKDIVALAHVPASEIHKEAAAPITVLTSPSGKKIVCHAEEPHKTTESKNIELTQFKNALMLVCKWAEYGHISNHPELKKIVERTRSALGGVKFND